MRIEVNLLPSNPFRKKRKSLAQRQREEEQMDEYLFFGWCLGVATCVVFNLILNR